MQPYAVPGVAPFGGHVVNAVMNAAGAGAYQIGGAVENENGENAAPVMDIAGMRVLIIDNTKLILPYICPGLVGHPAVAHQLQMLVVVMEDDSDLRASVIAGYDYDVKVKLLWGDKAESVHEAIEKLLRVTMTLLQDTPFPLRGGMAVKVESGGHYVAPDAIHYHARAQANLVNPAADHFWFGNAPPATPAVRNPNNPHGLINPNGPITPNGPNHPYGGSVNGGNVHPGHVHNPRHGRNNPRAAAAPVNPSAAGMAANPSVQQ